MSPEITALVARVEAEADHLAESGENTVLFKVLLDVATALREPAGEIEQWKKQCGIGVQSQFEEGRKYETQLAALRAALVKYGRHRDFGQGDGDGCKSLYGEGHPHRGPCDCGLADAIGAPL